MNEANDTLAVIRRQKAVYRRQLNETTDIAKRNELKEAIDVLSSEEKRWLDVILDEKF